MKIPWYSVCSFLVCSFRTNVKKGYLNDSVFRHCYGNFLECAILKVTFDHNYVQQHFERNPIVQDFTDMDQDVLQKQPSRGVPRKRLLKIGSKFTREHPCWSVISIKLLCIFIEIAPWLGCSLVYLLHIFRTPFPKNTSEWLLLVLILWSRL